MKTATVDDETRASANALSTYEANVAKTSM
jgi:hypothetical protein